MPNREMSYRAAAVAIISMAQQANPEPKGQSEFFWDQVIRWSNRVRRKGCFGDPLLKAPPELQGARFPGVEVTEKQDPEKNKHLDEAKELQLVVDDGPGKEEESLHFENDEDEGEEIETDRIGLVGRGCRRLDTAFIGDALVADIVPPVANKGDGGQEDGGIDDRDDEEQEKVPIIFHGLVRSPSSLPRR